jgi:hypothetical protein
MRAFYLPHLPIITKIPFQRSHGLAVPLPVPILFFLSSSVDSPMLRMQAALFPKRLPTSTLHHIPKHTFIIRCHLHTTLPLFPSLRQLNPIHIFTTGVLWICFDNTLPPMSSLRSLVFSLGIPDRVLHNYWLPGHYSSPYFYQKRRFGDWR